MLLQQYWCSTQVACGAVKGSSSILGDECAACLLIVLPGPCPGGVLQPPLAVHVQLCLLSAFVLCFELGVMPHHAFQEGAALENLVCQHRVCMHCTV